MDPEIRQEASTNNGTGKWKMSMTTGTLGRVHGRNAAESGERKAENGKRTTETDVMGKCVSRQDQRVSRDHRGNTCTRASRALGDTLLPSRGIDRGFGELSKHNSSTINFIPIAQNGKKSLTHE